MCAGFSVRCAVEQDGQELILTNAAWIYSPLLADAGAFAFYLYQSIPVLAIGGKASKRCVVQLFLASIATAG